MLNTEKMDFDVVVSGAGVAGTSCAIQLQNSGLNVLLIDRRKDISEYKTLCTHFIQPFSIPIIHELGIGQLLDSDHSVKTKAAFMVPGGKIDPEGGYGGNEHTAFAYNLERKVMDPILRNEASLNGVTLWMATSLTNYTKNTNSYSLDLSRSGQELTVTCKLIIAADGRNSKLAKLTGAPTESLANDRSAYFCYCTGIESPRNDRSIFVLNNSEMSFLYPLINKRTLLSVYIKKQRAEKWSLSDTSFENLIKLFQEHIPDMDFSNAKLDSPIFGYKKYENQIRLPVNRGIPFIGDACLSVDPMSGVGCGFAIKAANMLANCLIEHGFAETDKKELALAKYALEHESFFQSHVNGIVADSLVNKSDQLVSETYKQILSDEKLQRKYIDLTGRIITPEQFQKSYLFSVAKQKSMTTQTEA